MQQHRHITAGEWDTLAARPEFLKLVRARRRFVVPATIVFVAYYFALPLLVGFDPSLMSRPVLGPLTLAFCFALSQFAMAWILLALYLWRARSFDVEAALVAKHEREELRK
ncbi:MAG TPA: DUF485 domain-containing protein [Verrucomicrobiae bacterium]|nr:DUF485 domain-containing protein [Verrucomicrobiae bacterium]